MSRPSDLSALPARELDALVAREVMGWTVVDRADWIRRGAPSGEMVECDGELWQAERAGSATTPFRPSTDWRAMGTVLDALRERGFEFNIESSESGWTVSAFPESIKQRMVSADADTLPRAVALAALAAVGGK